MTDPTAWGWVMTGKVCLLGVYRLVGKGVVPVGKKMGFTGVPGGRFPVVILNVVVLISINNEK